MMPNEVRRLPRNKAILLIRGSKPLMLDKITPEEFPVFEKLQTCKAIEHIPDWRKKEKEPCVADAQSKQDAPTYPSMQVFFYICEYLQISPAEFFCEDNPNPKELNDILKDLKSLNYEKRMHIHEVIKDLIR